MTERVPLGDALRASLGEPRNVRLLDSSPRSRVWQVEIAGERAIVKQVTDAGDHRHGADERFTRELTGLRLAARGPVGPAVLGTDPTERVLVLEYLEDLGATDDWLPGYAAALARLHALTGVDDAGVLPRSQGPGPADVESFLAFATALDVPVPAGVPAELAALVERTDPAGHYALLHGDPCPGNDLRTAGGVRFVDFEHAALGDGIVELAYLRAGFPTCWSAMSVPATSLAEAEAVYRSTWRDATGLDVDVVGALADACAGWLIRGDALVERAHRATVDHLARATMEDFDWGYVSARERLVHRLGVVAETAHEPIRELGLLAAELRARLRKAGPDLRPLPGPDSRPW
ncbi:phosphotransferase [Streptomyces sp. SID3343]|uniref:phosphotransferase n=1 Tax=Streptomyces sp. SID3343 TaxID=2690260 RepID=UPI00136E22D1|nr:phosphotransferase [Streptomyces sp. SID3343]MYW01568.1 aminoglycoside phosphotransferase family protein [Streptomyces sp. SID3343]